MVWTAGGGRPAVRGRCLDNGDVISNRSSVPQVPYSGPFRVLPLVVVPIPPKQTHLAVPTTNAPLTVAITENATEPGGSVQSPVLCSAGMPSVIHSAEECSSNVSDPSVAQEGSLSATWLHTRSCWKSSAY